MAANDQTIKTFFASTGNNQRLSQNELDNIYDWVGESHDIENPVADDLVDALYETITQQAVSKLRRDFRPDLGDRRV